MKHIKFNSLNKPILTALLLTFATALSIPSGAGKSDPPPTSFEGLELVKKTKNGLLYKKPGLDLSTYSKISLAPSIIAFKENWQRDINRQKRSTSDRITDKDVTRIKTELAKIFDEVFKDELQTLKTWTMTNTIEKGVLLIRPAIINLDINAPDKLSMSRSRTYVDHAGEGTLFLEFSDGVSGDLLIRAIETRKTRDKGFHSWATKASNRADAKALLKQWAKQLRKKLEVI